MSSADVTGIDRQARLEQAIKLSRDMIDQAGRGEWQQIAELERQRRGDMVSALQAPMSESETRQVHDSLQQLMQLNSELAAMVKQARDESFKQFNELRQGREAAKAYQDVGKTS